MLKRRVMAIVCLSVIAGPAHSGTAFPYTSLGIAVGATSFDDDIIVDTGTSAESHSGAVVASIGGSIQFEGGPFFAASSGAMVSEGSSSEIEERQLNLGFGFPFPLNESFDLVPQLGFLYVDAEACVDNICATDDDSAISFGLQGRAWAVPEQLELGFGLSDTTLDDSDVVFGLSMGVWIEENNRLGLNLSTSDFADTFTIGYSYNWW